MSHLGWVRTAQGVINEGCERQDGYRDVGTNGKALRLIRMLGVDCVLKETRQRWSQGHPMLAPSSYSIQGVKYKVLKHRNVVLCRNRRRNLRHAASRDIYFNSCPGPTVGSCRAC